ncbi:hypothetical protein RFI_09337 [Reticulomyxa filosa]|uniref:CBS domain-containing protein n=1 Tax=Reticulomyxa filosa TaxID=46433 RepID=X6NPD5_RETFI|nr:hypothetical protein RFI_09337 [Reticulomyxa filosa]|eukprot:ETO27798.1 hypothetical protein RFI_09337 [Reticulomyxa filosa]
MIWTSSAFVWSRLAQFLFCFVFCCLYFFFLIKKYKLKDLILVNPSTKRPLGDYVYRRPMIMSPNTSMIQALTMFRDAKTHFALVTKDTDIVNECFAKNRPIPRSVTFLGCITMEDAIEQLIQKPIEDEFDTSTERPALIKEQSFMTMPIIKSTNHSAAMPALSSKMQTSEQGQKIREAASKIFAIANETKIDDNKNEMKAEETEHVPITDVDETVPDANPQGSFFD